MKKALLLTLVALLLPFAIGAQLLGSQELKFHHAPYALKTFGHRMMAPARVDLGENQMIMGHYDTDDLASSDGGLGITGLPGVISIGTIITPSELAMFQGGKIVKYRVGLAQATAISRVFLAPVTATGSIGPMTEWTCSSNMAGWNEIELPTPFDINLGEGISLLIGFDYQQTSSNYPISAVEVGDIYPSYILYNGSWQDVGLSSYGNLSLQCVVENESFPDYMVTVSNVRTKNYVKTGDDINYSFLSRNRGVAPVTAGACTYDVLIDGEVVETITNPSALSSSDVAITGAISSAGLEPGKHTITVTVNAINGEPVDVPMSSSYTFTIYVNGFPHQMHLIEQFTSTYCTYCPLGTSMLTILTGLRDDLVWVGIHGNMSGTDPMRTLQCDTIMSYQGSDSYPSGSFDRATGLASDDAIIIGLGYDEAYHQLIAEEISGFFLGYGCDLAGIHREYLSLFIQQNGKIPGLIRRFSRHMPPGKFFPFFSLKTILRYILWTIGVFLSIYRKASPVVCQVLKDLDLIISSFHRVRQIHDPHQERQDQNCGDHCDLNKTFL